MAAGNGISYRGKDSPAYDSVNEQSDTRAIRSTSVECCSARTSSEAATAECSPRTSSEAAIDEKNARKEFQQKFDAMLEAHRSRASPDPLASGAPGQPQNFGTIVPGLYRSSFPQAEDYEFLEGLKLKTIVTLVQKDFSSHFSDFVAKNGIKHHVVDMKGTKKEEIPAETMASLLRLVLDKRHQPLLIHCKQGRHRTGCVVGAVRKATGWQLRDVLLEYEQYAQPKPRDCDIDYLTRFQPTDRSIGCLKGAREQHEIAYMTFTGVGVVRHNHGPGLNAVGDLSWRRRVTLGLTMVVMWFILNLFAFGQFNLFFPHRN